MSSALMPAPSLALPALPSRAWLRNAGAAVVAVGLHALVLGLLLSQWPSDPPEPPQVRTLTTRLISLAPPAPPVPPQPEVVVAPPVPPEPVKPVEAPKPDPRLQQQKLELEQAALARKRVEERKRDEQRQEQQRIEQQRLEQQRREAEAQAQQQRLAEQQAQAAERARQAEAAAAASRQYLPIAKDAPDYPDRALDKGIQGDCTVSYRVNPQGRVENPQVVGDCHPLFIRPSLSAAKSFRYQPRIVDGQAVAVEGVKNTFHYRIE
ncbi:TonB family protein [Pseudomonas sp. L-22-4S-12]|uniref:energy transducer TonB n=1 Tax=Pseudomonas sp. L-22-4S-12 TaxID=2610893 RepID=UPI00132C59B3|nr:energy transducer TonB [Pseudomonas sp. L-22-4S-12]MWV15176.1 TonB family protein [Pseudomonas sp. L-22-4S-12]